MLQYGSDKSERTIIMKYLRFAFRQTLPVFFGYLFLGSGYGLLLNEAGYGWPWALLTSLFIYAGSMQYVLVSILGTHMSLLSVCLLTLSINSRHIFYGLSFIDKFKSMGKKYFYMIFSLTDETYSLLCGTKVPKELEEKKLLFWMAAMNQGYWILGSLIGSVAGSLLAFDTTGVDFAMTALFTVIFVEQWLSASSHIPAVIGILSGILSLILFGADQFILPSLVIAVTILCLIRPAMNFKKEEDTYAQL